jgi:hypothetical protein
MKKLLLLFIFAFISNAINAQLTCASPTTITGNGVKVCLTITGTYPATGSCWTTAGTKAIWYKFTPTSNGLITVDAGISPNSASTTDTRLSILTGTCSALTCVGGNDDINDPTDFRSRVTDFVVTSGTTYYIVWDSRWSTTSFSFQFTFTAASCFSPTGFTYTASPTTTTAGIGWTAPTVGTPSGYQFEYGLRGFTQGTGTVLNPSTTSASMTSLSPSSVYSFYVRTFCGGTDYSVWSGPITFNTVFQPVTPPYSTDLEDTDLGFLGWTSSVTGTGSTATDDWFLNSSSTLAQGGTTAAASLSNTTSASSGRMYSRGINLVANQVATVSYYVRNYLATGATGSASYQLTVGNTQTAASQTTILANEPAIANTTFELKTFTYTPSTTGVYYFSFLNNSPANASTQALIVDTFSVTQTLSVNEFLNSKFSVSPNPANNFISISNAENILVSGISITDLNGRVVKQNTYNNVSDIQINVSDLASGMYMLNIISDKGSFTKKIVKN